MAQHFHMPLQSGTDRILAAMHRWYRAEQYARRVQVIRECLPQAAIGADVIAGFPGETDDEHRATLAFIESLPLTYLHVFSFSKRPGTAAANLRKKFPRTSSKIVPGNCANWAKENPPHSAAINWERSFVCSHSAPTKTMTRALENIYRWSAGEPVGGVHSGAFQQLFAIPCSRKVACKSMGGGSRVSSRRKLFDRGIEFLKPAESVRVNTAC